MHQNGDYADAIDLFAGPGGWDVACQRLGLDVIGVEWDELACTTARAAGHRRLWADVSHLDPQGVADAYGWTGGGLIASPPCQDFSIAGNRAGVEGDKGHLVTEALRWATALQPAWVALEQVPEVLPIWKHYAHELRGMGYAAWAGVLEAADYGVPQTRERAILIARRSGSPLIPPVPSHARESEPESMFGPGRQRWRTLANATGRPAPWVLSHIRGQGMVERHGQRPGRQLDEPGFTVLAWKDSRMRWEHPDGRRERFTLADSLAVQGFPPNYPVAGSQTRAQEQIGNAVPPALAWHVLRAALGLAATEWPGVATEQAA